MEKKNNSFALFKNKRKEKDTHPDYTGNGLINGTDCWISAWVKKTQAGETYFSCSVKPKDAVSDFHKAVPKPSVSFDDDLDDSVPF